MRLKKEVTMRISIDDKHTLYSDKYCCWLVKTVNGKKGPYEMRISGYHRTFEDLVEKYIDTGVLGSKATDLKALSDEITQLKNEVRSWNHPVKK